MKSSGSSQGTQTSESAPREVGALGSASHAEAVADSRVDKNTLPLQQHEIEETRGHLDSLLTELDHRRHAFGFRQIVVRHQLPLLFGAGAVAVAAIAGAVIGGRWQYRRVQRRNSLAGRAGRLRLALERAVRSPDDVARTTPSLPKRVLASVLVAVAGLATRKLLAQVFEAAPIHGAGRPVIR
jgi:hypothetical protein